MTRYDGATFTNFTAADGLASNQVREILQDRGGNLWFATSRGVSKSKLDAGRIAFENFTVAQGLQGSDVRSILQDRRGYIWVSVDEGVGRFAVAEDSGRTVFIPIATRPAMWSPLLEDQE